MKYHIEENLSKSSKTILKLFQQRYFEALHWPQMEFSLMLTIHTASIDTSRHFLHATLASSDSLSKISFISILAKC